jgi:hypothetical protein
MRGNEKEEWMEDHEVNIILSSELQMMKKSLSNNCRREESRTQKFEIGVLGVLA